jgi:hypothetical protein
LLRADPVLLLLDLHLGGAADADQGDAAGQLGETLLQVILVVVLGGLLTCQQLLNFDAGASGRLRTRDICLSARPPKNGPKALRRSGSKPAPLAALPLRDGAPIRAVRVA